MLQLLFPESPCNPAEPGLGCAEPPCLAYRKWVEEKAKNQVLESKLVNAATYEVQVTTGSVKGAATDARVYLELYGPDFCPATSPTATVGTLAGIDGCGSGGEVRLFDIDSHEKPFQRGALDSFTVVCHNVGHPARLKVWHDNTGRHPDWFLVEIKVRKKGTKDWACFPCSRWAHRMRVPQVV